MPAPGSTPILIYNSATASQVPLAANLSQGELAINVTDKKLYSKDSGGNVILIASSGGDVTGPATSTNLAIPTFSGTTGKLLLNNSGVTISSGVITGTGFTGALNGSLGATTPSTVVATDLTTTGNTILGNASTDTLNVGNGDLVKDASGNVGIGTASPNAKLDILATSNTIRLGRSTSSYATIDSNSNAGSLSLNADAGNIAGGGSMTFLFAGSEKMRIDASGNLGLGVTPSAWGSGTYKGFQIGGSASLMGRAGGTDSYLMANTYYDQTNYRYVTTGLASSYSQNAGMHAWYTAPSGTAGNAITFTQAMTLDASGNLGVGETSPSTYGKLTTTGYSDAGGVNIWVRNTSDVSGDNVKYAGIQFSVGGDNGSTAIRSYRTNSSSDYQSALAFLTKGTGAGATTPTERMRLDSSGNLGLGVTPSTWTDFKAVQVKDGSLAVYSDASQDNLSLSANAYYGTGWKYIKNAVASRYEQTAGAHAWFTAPSGTAGNAITFTQAMTLDASGNLLVGTTAQIASGKLSLAADHVTHQGITIKNTNAANALVYIYFLNSAGAGAGTITQTAATTVAYATSSDYRLKENIAPMTDALATVAKLKPVTYNWVADGSDGQGFIAHELAEIVPDCVVGEKDAVNEDGSIKAQAIDTSFLVATLTAALQEAHGLIKDLQVRVEALEAK
jgi:hypothetical protein